MRDGALYINSLNEVLQCRPTFRNMHPPETQKEVNDNSDNESQENDEKGLHQVALKRKESEKAQAIRLQSYSYVHAQEEAEEWRTLKVHQPTDQETLNKLKSFFQSSS